MVSPVSVSCYLGPEDGNRFILTVNLMTQLDAVQISVAAAHWFHFRLALLV
jgi:hypothetical protein